MFAATAYIEKGMYPEAIAEACRAVEITNRSVTHPLAVLGYALAKSGDVAQARGVLEDRREVQTSHGVFVQENRRTTKKITGSGSLVLL